jgi:Flp pilus assembly protein TadG
MRRIFGDVRGASAVEFALLAPVFLLFVFGVIETGRYVWTRQVVQQAAYSAVRCFALGAAGCADANAARAYAVAEAAKGGIEIDLAAVEAQLPVTCDGVAGQGRVRIDTPFASALPAMLPQFAQTISTSACFPPQPPES